MKLLTFVFALFLVTPAAGTEFLVRVADAALTSELASRVTERFDGWSLAVVDEADLDRLVADGVNFEVLDAEPRGKAYTWVMPSAGVALEDLEPHGTILFSGDDGVLMRTTQQGILGLNRMQVELAGIGTVPLPVSRVLPSTPRAAEVPDSLILELVGRVSADSLEAVHRRLIDFRTRYSTTDSCNRAMEWTRDRFIEYNCDSTVLDSFLTEYAPNAIGVKLGVVNPQRIYVVCGHVDATSEVQFVYTPGSDDNASGAATVLEACRVFADVEFENSVYFIGFAGEEQGLVGSDSFARKAQLRGDSILLAMNFDMVSYGREGLDTIVIYGANASPPSVEFVDFFRAQADTFSALKHIADIENVPERRSDHYSFWKYGFPFLRGGYYDRTPEYHTTGDTIGPPYFRYCGTNNFPMQAEMVKALVAVIAKLGGVQPAVGVCGGGRGIPTARALAARPSVGTAPVRVMLSRRPEPGSKLEVVDAAGRLVRVLATRGEPIVAWDGRDASGLKASPGVYFLRLPTSGITHAARVVLLGK